MGEESLRRRGGARIHPWAIIASDAVIGRGTRVWAFAQVRERSVIGAHCMIGNGVYIDQGVQVGSRCNIHNRALLYRNLSVGNHVFIGPAVCFVNDPMPRANRIRSLKGLTSVVKDGASLGALSVVMPEITIGKYSVVAAGAVVTHDVPDFALVKGVPARIKGFVDPQGNRLKPLHAAGSRLVLSSNSGRFRISVKRELYETIG